MQQNRTHNLKLGVFIGNIFRDFYVGAKHRWKSMAHSNWSSDIFENLSAVSWSHMYWTPGLEKRKQIIRHFSGQNMQLGPHKIIKYILYEI